MLILNKIILITILLIELKSLTIAQYQKCKSPSVPVPKDFDAICVPTEDCKVVNDIIKRNPKAIPPPITEYIKKGNCGEQNGIKYLCCKMGYLSFNVRQKYEKDIRSKPSVRPIQVPSQSRTLIFEGTESTIKETSVLNHPNSYLLPENCQILNIQLEDRLSNGDDAQIFEFRFIALMLYETINGYESTFFCGGSLISSKYVLTAAHCVKVQDIILKAVRLGEYNTKTNPDCTPDKSSCTNGIQDIGVESFKTHENYDISKFANDIALIRLSQPVNFNVNNVQPLCLPIYPELQTVNINYGIIAGWGATERFISSTILQKASIPIINKIKCKDIFRKYNIEILDSHICAGGKDYTGSCRGDSGGPLFTMQKYGSNILPRFVQHGIVSGGSSRCGTNNFPALYANVSYFITWILDNIKP